MQVTMRILAILIFLIHFGAANCSAQDALPVQDATSDAQSTGLALRSALPLPVQKEPTLAQLDQSKGQQWHRNTLRLSGSMCPSCLLELEEKLRRYEGVAFVAIARDGQPGSEINKPRTAFATIIYDGLSINSEALMACIKSEKYKPLEAQDVLLAAK